MANRPARMRMCVACRETRPQTKMIRVVRTKEGIAKMDDTGKADGRGAYICMRGECVEKARRERRLERALHCKIPEEIFAQIGDIHA